jgi:hypothetical protein
MTADASLTGKTTRPNIALTTGSRVRVYSAGPENAGLVSVGIFRGLVSVAGDNVLALELDEPVAEKGRIRLISTAALWAVDIIEAAKPEEERRSEKPAISPGYFG